MNKPEASAGDQPSIEDYRDLEIKLRGALGLCLSALIRMIPGACAQHDLEQCTVEEHDAAIAAAAAALYGNDPNLWAPVLRAAAGRKYE